MKENYNHLISKFLENELSNQEAEEVKAKYGSDERFTEQVNTQSMICIALKVAAEMNRRSYRMYRYYSKN